MADCAETYHHWRVFSHGTGGACIQFKREPFLDAISKVEGLRAKHINYKTITALRTTSLVLDELPYLKRSAFGNEGEFRLFYASTTKGPPTYRIPIPLSCVDRIILSPWLPKTVADLVKRTLKAIPGCSRVRIYRSTLVENEEWKKFANIRC